MYCLHYSIFIYHAITILTLKRISCVTINVELFSFFAPSLCKPGHTKKINVDSSPRGHGINALPQYIIPYRSIPKLPNSDF